MPDAVKLFLHLIETFLQNFQNSSSLWRGCLKLWQLCLKLCQHRVVVRKTKGFTVLCRWNLWPTISRKGELYVRKIFRPKAANRPSLTYIYLGAWQGKSRPGFSLIFTGSWSRTSDLCGGKKPESFDIIAHRFEWAGPWFSSYFRAKIVKWCSGFARPVLRFINMAEKQQCSVIREIGNLSRSDEGGWLGIALPGM